MVKDAQEKKDNYEVIWRDCPSSEGFASLFFDGFKGEVRPGQTITIFGCKAARVAKEFLARGLNVTLVDISPYCLDEEIRHMLPLYSHQIQFHQACLWDLPKEIKSTYWIYCCGVLEHIPKQKIDAACKQMAARMRFGGYFSIRMQEDHSEKKRTAYWEKKLSQYYRIVGVDAVADDLYFNPRVCRKITK